jgi:cysteine desulfurase
MIYLDHNATTPLAHEVARAMCTCLRTNFGNPSSSHAWGTRAKEAVEAARSQVASLIGAKKEEIYFTSGGTEANNMALLGTALRFRRGHIITSSIEHPSVVKPLTHLEGLGYKVTYLPVDASGIIDPELLRKSIRKETVLITVMHANNETGAIQPIAEIGSIARERSITFHCDAAQSVGKIPVHVKRLKLDLVSVVSHKFYGPKGVGALFVKNAREIKSLLFGASHERGLRPGTENVAGIVGLGIAAKLAKKEMKDRVAQMKHLSNLLYDELHRHIPEVRLNGHFSKRLPNTLNMSFPNVQGSALLDALKNDIAASTGSACHEGTYTPSSVLKAMGLSDADALSALRLSMGRGTSERQVRMAVKAIVKAYKKLNVP